MKKILQIIPNHTSLEAKYRDQEGRIHGRDVIAWALLSNEGGEVVSAMVMTKGGDLQLATEQPGFVGLSY